MDDFVSKKRVNVSLSVEQVKLIRKLKGIMGNSDSEIIRNILLAWFSEKNMISLNNNDEYDAKTYTVIDSENHIEYIVINSMAFKSLEYFNHNGAKITTNNPLAEFIREITYSLVLSKQELVDDFKRMLDENNPKDSDILLFSTLVDDESTKAISETTYYNQDYDPSLSNTIKHS